MAEEIGDLTKNEIEKRFTEIAEHPDTIMLEFPGKIISHKPIQSKGYANCNGVVLLNHRFVGLSHYDLKEGPPEKYLPELIEETLNLIDTEGLTAVLIGGDANHYQRNKKILEEYKIPIVAEYVDGWMEEEFRVRYRNKTKVHKDLVVIPNTQEVLIYRKRIEYLRLYPGEIYSCPVSKRSKFNLK